MADTETQETEKTTMIDPKYRERYGKAKHCGDDVAEVLKEETTGKDGKLDLDKLAKVAKQNKIEFGKYEHLNRGQLRMTIGNILRGQVRKGNDVKIGSVTVEGDEVESESEAA